MDEQFCVSYSDATNLYLMNNYSILPSGELTPAQVREHQKKSFESDEDQFMTELKKMLCDHHVFEERRRQIETASHLDSLCTGAKTILELREAFKLTGDFSNYERIMASVSKAFNINSIFSLSTLLCRIICSLFHFMIIAKGHSSAERY